MELSTYELIKYPTGQYVLLRAELKDPANPEAGMSSLMDPVGFFTNEDEARQAFEQVASKRADRTQAYAGRGARDASPWRGEDAAP